jgi:hypothetical protein
MAKLTRRGVSNIKLAAEVPEDEDKLVWVQVAEEGQFDGYAGGEVSFAFDETVFNQMVANFRNHPSYSNGATDVIPWDFHHASEQAATDGTIPFSGAPAQGWVREMEVRFNSTGAAQRWANTRWLEPARGYIKEGRYQWASVSVVFDAVDPKSGANVGALLTSIALTNQPFIEGMTPLAASKQAAQKELSRYFYAEPAKDAQHAIESIRDLLGLPETADAAAVMAELTKVAQWLATGTAPLGVDLDDIVGNIRRVLNLPALSSNEEVLAEIEKLPARLIPESGVDTGGETPPLPPSAEPPQPPVIPATQLENDMAILKLLAEKLGVVENEEAVLGAVTELSALREAFATHIGLSATASSKVILKAAPDDASVRTKFGSILPMLGVEDVDAAMDKIAEVLAQAEELKTVAPELAALKKKEEEREEVEADEDVDAVLNSMNATGNEGLRLALSHLRKSKPEEFAATYPKADLEKTKQLTRKVAAGTEKPGVENGSGDAIDLSAFAGRNRVEQAISLLSAQQAGFKDLSWEDKNKRANTFLATGKVSG